MRKKLLASTRWSIALTIILVFFATVVLGQTNIPISRTQCKQWDDAFLTIFNWSLIGALFGTCILSLLSGLLGKFFWLFSSSSLRVIFVTISCLIIVLLGGALGPWTVGLGWGWFRGIDPRYFGCASVQFGARGLFEGQWGAGVPAIAQTPATIIALSAAAIFGGLSAWLLSSIALRFLGVKAKVSGERQ